MEETRAGGGGGAAGGEQDAALARASEEKATLLDMVTTNPHQLLLVAIKLHKVIIIAKVVCRVALGRHEVPRRPPLVTA